jgi:GNAT superfamily N-acetyltransferase
MNAGTGGIVGAVPLDTLTLRAGSAADAAAIEALALAELERSPPLGRLTHVLARFPSVVAHEGDEMRGFVFGVALAPDILEMGNLLVAEPYRNAGLGTRLMEAFEDAARGRYRAIIAANSTLWSIAGGEKRPAVSLYERHGYRPIYSTPDSVVMIKELDGER